MRLGLSLVPGFVCLAVTVFAPAARADDPAQQFYRSGQVAYDSGQYRAAALDFEMAYQKRPLPALLFNAAQAWRHEFEQHGGRDAARKAIDGYRRYLAAPNVNESDRREAVEHLATLSALLASEDPAPAPTPAPVATTTTAAEVAAPPPPKKKRTGLYVGIGVGVVVLVGVGVGVGLAFGLKRSDAPTLEARF